MNQIDRIKEEGFEALKSLGEYYSEEELLHPEELLDKWQVPELTERES